MLLPDSMLRHIPLRSVSQILNPRYHSDYDFSAAFRTLALEFSGLSRSKRNPTRGMSVQMVFALFGKIFDREFKSFLVFFLNDSVELGVIKTLPIWNFHDIGFAPDPRQRVRVR